MDEEFLGRVLHMMLWHTKERNAAFSGGQQKALKALLPQAQECSSKIS